MADFLFLIGAALLVSCLACWLFGRGASRLDHPSDDDRKRGRRG